MSTIQETKYTDEGVVDIALFKGSSLDELLEQAEIQLDYDVAFAYKLADQAETIAKQYGAIEKIARAKSFKGASLYKQDKPKLAIAELNDALAFAKSPMLKSLILNRMAYCHFMLAECKMTIMLSQEALKIAQEFDTKEGRKQQVFSYNNIGIAYYRLGVYDAATTAYLNGLDVADESDEQVKHLYSNLSLVRQELGDFDTAFKYAEKALELAIQQQDNRTKAQILGNFSYLYFDIGNYEKSIGFAQQALTIEKAYLDTRLHQYHNLAQAYRKTNDYIKAQAQVDYAHGILKGSPPSQILAELLRCEAKIAYAQGDLKQAEVIMNQAKDVAETTKYLAELYKIHIDLSTFYEKLGQPQKALEHHKEFHRIQTQVHSDAAERRIQGLMIQHEVEELIRVKDETVEKNSELEQLVDQRTIEIEEAHMEMLERLAIAGEKRDDDTGEHTERVGRVCGLIAKELGCDDIYVETIQIAARLHDVGKIGVPDTILLKPARLTDDEFEIVKSHAAIGAEMLANSKSKHIQMAERIAGTHHEHWNGRGYPNGISGTDIPLEGRIVAVADVYDALTNERPYKSKWTHEEALAELIKSSDSHLDKNVVDAFKGLFEKGIISPEELREKPKEKAKITSI